METNSSFAPDILDQVFGTSKTVIDTAQKMTNAFQDMASNMEGSRRNLSSQNFYGGGQGYTNPQQPYQPQYQAPLTYGYPYEDTSAYQANGYQMSYGPAGNAWNYGYTPTQPTQYPNGGYPGITDPGYGLGGNY